ncbi:MAG: sensor histidine kinase [Bacteroidota bacterium]
MEGSEKLIFYMVIASSAVVFLVIAVLIDLFFLTQKRKKISQQEIELRQNEIDELIMKQEVENVTSLLKGQKSERRRISQELHDRLGSILFTAKLYHTNIGRKIEETQQVQKEGIEKLSGLLNDAIQEVRRISHDLYDGSLVNFGYIDAVKKLTEALMEANDLTILHKTNGDITQVQDEIQQDLYAITQELLSNTLKHSQASKVEIKTYVDSKLVFDYRDNGKGFDNSRSFSGIGLKNIESRVAKHDGKILLESGSEKGTFYNISIPLVT